MKFLGFLIICMGAVSFSCAQVAPAGTKPKIKSVLSVDFPSVEEGKKGKKDTYLQYDAAGNKIEEKIYDSEGALKRKIICKYDSKGNKTEEIVYDEEGVMKDHVIFKVDLKGNKTEETVLAPSGAVKERKIFTYDADGNRVRRETYNAKKQLISVRKYIYEYYE